MKKTEKKMGTGGGKGPNKQVIKYDLAQLKKQKFFKLKI